MPKPSPHPSTRTDLWRKVHVRLAVLGMTPVQLTLRIYPEIEFAKGAERTSYSTTVARWFAHPRRLTPERRRKLETALELADGMLCSTVSVLSVAAAPVPLSYLCGPSLHPECDALNPPAALVCAVLVGSQMERSAVPLRAFATDGSADDLASDPLLVR